MPLTVRCPNCQHRFDLADTVAGRQIVCGNCKARFVAGGSTVTAAPAAPSAVTIIPRTTLPNPTASIGPSGPPNGLLGDRYELRSELGQGAFGVVYLAFDGRLSREVAIKMLKSEALGDADAVRRFETEAQVTARMEHPHIVRLYDRGQHEGRHYLVSAFIRGRTLHDLIQTGGPLPPARAAALVAPLAEALHYAHTSHGILHRDVKPANVMVEGDTSYLMDFGLGLCRTETQVRQTQAGHLLGTIAFMSPEQARGDLNAVGPAADLYSLGVVLYEVLTGRLPFTNPNLMGLLQDIQTLAPPAPRSLRPGLNARLEQVILRALSKQPSQRFASGQEFAAALRAAVAETGTGPALPATPAKPPALPRDRVKKPSKPAVAKPKPPPELPKPEPVFAPVKPPATGRRWLIFVVIGIVLAVATGIGIAVAMKRSDSPAVPTTKTTKPGNDDW